MIVRILSIGALVVILCALAFVFWIFHSVGG
jgi:hypothetical protein